MMLEYLKAGISIFPVNGKEPVVKWSIYRDRFPTEQEVANWPKGDGVAMVGGAMSGNLLCLDFDEKNDPKKTITKEFFDLLKEWGYSELAEKLVTEKTPSGGYHVLLRSESEVGRNQKIARDPSGPQAIIETRGEGGYFVCAPSPGYKVIRGSMTDIPVLTAEETGIVMSACWALDRSPPPEPAPIPKHEWKDHGKSPLNDYNDRAGADELLDILYSHDWRKVTQVGENIRLCRPGKSAREWSATFHLSKRIFYVFTSSTNFQSDKGHSPASVYIEFIHNGDVKAAVKDLASKGYGEQRQEKRKEYRPLIAAAPVSEIAEPVFVDLHSMRGEILNAFDKPQDRGLDLEWPSLEYRVADHQLTIVTGLPSHGKSTVMNSIAVHLAEKHGWRFIIHSAEDYPIKKLVDKIIRRHLKKSMYSHDPMTKAEYMEAYDWVCKHFIPVNANKEDLVLSDITRLAEAENAKGRIHGLIIDPWNEIDDHPDSLKETDFIKMSLRDLRKMSRRLQMHIWILAHPKGLQRNKDGKWPKPELSDISGSAHWRNKADNGLVIWQDMETRITSVQVHKIKFADYGKMGTSVDLAFDEPTQVFRELNSMEKKLKAKAPEPEERDIPW